MKRRKIFLLLIAIFTAISLIVCGGGSSSSGGSSNSGGGNGGGGLTLQYSMGSPSQLVPTIHNANVYNPAPGSAHAEKRGWSSAAHLAVILELFL